MKFYNYDIVFQEIPDEVTLAVNITNCPNLCSGCHSPHLREDIGIELSNEELDELLIKYKGAVTCLCIMGGDADVKEVECVARYAREKYGIKIAWYSGRDLFPPTPSLFDYIKLGAYLPDKGSLKDKNTNQRLYKMTEGVPTDITSRFWK